jgi:hypothetical protein
MIVPISSVLAPIVGAAETGLVTLGSTQAGTGVVAWAGNVLGASLNSVAIRSWAERLRLVGTTLPGNLTRDGQIETSTERFSLGDKSQMAVIARSLDLWDLTDKLLTENMYSVRRYITHNNELLHVHHTDPRLLARKIKRRFGIYIQSDVRDRSINYMGDDISRYHTSAISGLPILRAKIKHLQEMYNSRGFTNPADLIKVINLVVFNHAMISSSIKPSVALLNMILHNYESYLYNLIDLKLSSFASYDAINSWSDDMNSPVVTNSVRIKVSNQWSTYLSNIFKHLNTLIVQ